MPATHPLNGQKWPGTDTYYWDPGKAPGEPGFVAPDGYVPPDGSKSSPPAKSFDEYKKDHVDDKIKNNNGDPRHGGGNNKPDATLGELNGNGAKVEAADVVLENFDGMDYETIRSRMMNVSENIAPGYNDTLRGVAQQIVSGLSDLKDRLDTLESDGGWKGKTHDAAMANLEKSYDIPEELRKGAFSLGVLSEYYSQTMSTNKHNILDQWQTYQNCLSYYPSETDTVKQYFNDFARDVMKNYYSPEINDIASHQPAVGSTAAPDVGVPGGGNDGGNDNGGNDDGGNENGGNDNGGGGGNNPPPPPFTPREVAAIAPGGGSPGGGSPGGGSPGGGSPGGGSPSGGGSAGAESTPKQSFNPPTMPDLKSPDLPSDSADGSPAGTGPGSAGGSPSGSNMPGGNPPTPPTLPSLGANSPQLPDLGGSDDPSNAGVSGTGAKFDPSKVLTDPKSIDAANKLFNDPKTADAAKKLFGDPKFADAAKTLFGDGAKGLLNDPKALDAAKTLFGDPKAADAAKALFGDPDTAKAAQRLLNDPHLDDIGKALKDSGALPATGPTGLDSTSGVDPKDLSRSLLSPSGLNNAGGIPGLAASTAGSPSDGASSLIGGIMDGVNQIVQTAQQGASQQPPGFGGPGFDGAPGGPGDHAGAGGGHGGGAAGGGAAGPGKLHLAGVGAPVAAANFSPMAHAGALHTAGDPSQTGSGGGGAPSGGGHGGGGKGGEAKDHKGNKALRGNQNGQDLIGQPDAVVSVIGEDGVDGGPGWSGDN